MRIAFFGTPQFAQEVLAHIAQFHTIVAVITQPDRPFGRKQELKAPAVKEFAQKQGYKIFQPLSLEENLLQELDLLGAELFLVVAYGAIFPQSFLNSKPSINLHASLLPHLRGASPLQEMILEEKRRFGVSVMKMEEGLDSGEILAMSYLISPSNLSLEELSKILASLGGKLVLKVLERERVGMKQIHCDASWCKKIKKEQGRVDFSSAQKIATRFLAFSSWPGVFLSSGLKLLKFNVHLHSNQAQEGKIIAISKESVSVACSDGVVEIFEVQPPNKQRMSAVDYLRGKHWEVGENFC